MKDFIEAEILENTGFSGVFSMTLHAPGIARNCVPGQFVNLYTGNESMLLPRPISICHADTETGTLRLVFQPVGAGTELFSKMNTGQKIKLLGPLGNGNRIAEHKSHTLVGGGIGVPPLLFLAKTLRRAYPDCRIQAFLGFRTQCFLTEEFEAAGVRTHIATDDGSVGFHGNAVEMLRAAGGGHDVLYSCGPKPMLRAVEQYALEKMLPYQLSMEERMACGLGACVGCIADIGTETGAVRKKVCSDGPVFCFNAGIRAFPENS